MKSAFKELLFEAISSHTPLPEFDEGLSLEEAYELQHAVTIARSPNGVSGIKAGVTSQLAQSFFKLDHALIGSLYADARREIGCAIPFLKGRALECEVAVLVDGNGTPKQIAPAIEVVFVSYSRQSDMSAASLVACNLGADLFIVGEFLPWNPKFNLVPIELKYEGEVVNTSNSTEALEGPEAAVAWMWEEAIRRGFKPTDDTLILTGACGTVMQADAGRYEATFGALGNLHFHV